MPVKNCGQWLKPAVESILNQTCENFELLVIDDHSYDGSIELLPHDSRIKIFRHNGSGIVSNLNLGLLKARGRFIARMDGDDISLPDRFQNQLDFARLNPAYGIIGGRVEIFTEGGDIQQGNLVYQDWLNRLITPVQISREIFVESPLVHPSTFIRREVFKKIGLYRDLSWPEDYDLWLRAWLKNVQIAKVPEYVLRWRDHSQRLTRTDKRYSQKEFIKLKAWALSESLLKNRSAFICGTGKLAAKLCDLLQSLQVRVKGFVDIAPDKIGKTRRNLPIYSLEEMLARRDKSMIIGAVSTRGSSAKLRNLLIQYGLEESRDFILAA